MQERQTIADRSLVSSIQEQVVNQVKSSNTERLPVGEQTFSMLLEKFEGASLSRPLTAGAVLEKSGNLEVEAIEKSLVTLSSFDMASTSPIAPNGKVDEEKKPEPIPGDINGDGIVDGSDLGLLLSLWGTDSPQADLNGDGIVDLSDLNILLSNWTTPDEEEPTTPVPGDVNGDGVVDGTDLDMLLKLWGTDAPLADFNGDGVVDSTDLAILLGNWTSPDNDN